MPQKSPCNDSVQVSITPRALRPDAAGRYLGISSFRIEELMREGVLEFVIVPGSDTRVVLVETLDKFITGLPRQNGKLPGRGIHKIAA